MVQGRIVCLALLTVQNASVSLLTRHSLVSTSSQQRYSPPVAVLTTELVKALISAVMLVWSTRPGTPRHVTRQLRRVFATSAVVDMTVPAALYSVQNRLLYVALSNLSAAVFQTTYQLKLVTTALFSCWFLDSTPSASLSTSKLVSLALLTVGIAVVQLGNRNRDSSPTLALEEKRAARGLAAIVVACVSSGFAGVWFERVLKSSSSRARRDQQEPVSIWVRNLQLSVPSIAFASIAVYSSSPLGRGLWSGFTPLVWAVVLNQAIGGLLVSLVSLLVASPLTSCSISAFFFVVSDLLLRLQCKLQFTHTHLVPFCLFCLIFFVLSMLG